MATFKPCVAVCHSGQAESSHGIPDAVAQLAADVSKSLDNQPCTLLHGGGGNGHGLRPSPKDSKGVGRRLQVTCRNGASRTTTRSSASAATSQQRKMARSSRGHTSGEACSIIQTNLEALNPLL